MTAVCALAVGMACQAFWTAPAHAEEEIIVRASRLAAFHGDSAFAVTDLPAENLDRGALDQGLKRETQASLFRRQSSLSANPTIQGISLRAIGPSGAGRALVTLDGVPQNDPFGGWVIWAALPEGAVDQAHILKGAGGGAYGAGALTGVIDLTLKSPGEPVYAQAQTGGEGDYRLSGGGGWRGFGVSLASRKMNGDTTLRPPQAGAADGPVTGRDQALLMNAEHPLCTGGGCATLAFLGGAYDSRRDTGLVGATATSTGYQAGLSLTRQPSRDAMGWRLQVWHRGSDLSNRSVSVDAGRTGTTLANDQVKTPATGDGFNAALRHSDPDREWEIGTDARKAGGESREYYRYMAGQATRYRVSGGKTSLMGLYAEGSQRLGRMTVTGAVRADRWRTYDGHRRETDTLTGARTLEVLTNSRAAEVVTARAGVAYAASLSTTVRLAAYTGFRPPTLNELYRPFRVGNDVTEANAELNPENLKGIDLGVRIGDAHGFVDVGLFVMRMDGPVTNVTVAQGPGTFPVAGFIPAGGSLRQRQNLGLIEAHGLEFRGRYEVRDGLALTTAGTFTNARVRRAGALDGKRPAQAPDYSLNLGVDARVAKAQIRAGVQFEGAAFENDLNTLRLPPSRNVWLDMDYPLTPGLALTLAIENALDDRIALSRAGDGTLSYDNRRRASVGFKWKG